VYLQWLFLKRIFAGHSPLRLTVLMTVGNILLGVGSLYYLSNVVGTHGMRGAIYQEFGGVAAFLSVGLSMNAMLTVGCNAVARAITDEQSMGTLGFWMMCRPNLLSMVLKSSVGEFLLAAVNAVITFVLMVFLFRVHFNVDPVSLIVVGLLSVCIVAGVGLWAAGLFIGGYKGQNPVLWAWSVSTNFMAGVYAPIEIFKESNQWLYWLMYSDPVTHELEAMRLAVLRHDSLMNPELQAELLYVAAFVLVILPLGIWQFQRGLHKALEQNKVIES
jgi:ABC-type multidrug transport system permease subunit